MNKYLVIFLIAIFVRLLLAALFIDIFAEWPTGSSKEYRIKLAESIIHGKGFSYEGIPNLYQTPVYPFFLAIIFLVLGSSWWSIALFQSILEGFSSVTISKMGINFSKCGWLAGYIYAFYPYAAMQSRSISDTSIFVLIFILTIYFYIKFISNQRLKYLIIASLFLGIGILDRPSIFILGPAFIILLFARKIQWKKCLLFVLISFFIAILIPFIWILRNYGISGRFPVLSVAGQHFMWYGHNEHIYNILKRRESPDQVGGDHRYPMQPNFKVIDFFKVAPEKQIELAERCMNIVKKWISNNKSEVKQYTLLKLKRFMSWEYDIQNQEIPFQRTRILIYRITTAPIIIFGWLGVFLLFFKRKDIAFYLLTVIIGFISIHIFSNFESRHKIPFFAILMTIIPVTIQYLCLIAKKQIRKYKIKNSFIG